MAPEIPAPESQQQWLRRTIPPFAQGTAHDWVDAIERSLKALARETATIAD